jgi:hypothetical protein
MINIELMGRGPLACYQRASIGLRATEAYANLRSPVTEPKINSNRDWKLLETSVTQTKQSPEVMSNRDKMRGPFEAPSGQKVGRGLTSKEVSYITAPGLFREASQRERGRLERNGASGFCSCATIPLFRNFGLGVAHAGRLGCELRTHSQYLELAR